MERDSLVSIIKNNLKDYGINQNLSKSTIEQLFNIEQYFIECENELENAHSKIKNINITVRGISKETGIGKSTIYKNPKTLKIYIEKRQEKIRKKDIFPEKKLVETNKRLNSLIEKTKVNIINHHLLENQVEELTKENLQLETKIQYLVKKEINLFHKLMI